nr:chitobiase/beta-hexosaminidase C-terminal domain-containing protein [Bacteroidales bacterium]
MTRHLHSDHKDPHRTRHGIRWLPTALSTLLFMLLMPASAQTPVNIRSASYSGRSLEWSQGDPYSAGYVETSIDADTKQQWVMVNAGNGSFYLKNVAAEAAGANPYLTLYKSGASNDNWTFSMTDETGLASEIHYFRARFSLVDNGDGTWAFKTMSSKNNAATHIYTYIGIDAPSGSRTHHTIWGDKQIADGGKWTIDGLSTINIERSAGTITITATNTTDATVYYTTDGTDPTTSTTRQVYSTSFADNNIALVKAIVMKDGRPNSELALSYDYSMSFVLQHQLNTEFYMLPGALNGNDYEVNTYSLPRPSMTWKLEDAGDGSVYLRNDSTGYYLSCNDGGTVRLKATNNQSNDFKFWLRLAVDGTYRLEAKAKTYSFITKSDNNSHNSVGYNNNAKISLQNYWRIIPADHMPALEPPFTLSDNSCAHYYRLQNGGESAYYIIPPTESNVNASASNAGERNDRWFLRQVGSDEWLTYYAIVNATTGQCLQYNGVALGGGAAFITDTVAEDDMGTTDNIQFAVAPTTTSATNGMYYLVPKLIRYQNSGNYYSLVRYDNTVLKVNSQRADDKHKWVFAASTFNCDAPTVSYDAVQGILTLTSPNNAPLYYVAWADGEAEPALATPAEGTLYSEPFFVEQNTHFKAIAARCTDGSDQSAVTAYDLAEAFRCARPKITYNSSTKQVSIAS